MIFHVASTAAFFVDQLAQTPVVVQCVVPPNTDPGWKQWVQPILNLVSIAVSEIGPGGFSAKRETLLLSISVELLTRR